MSDTKDASSQDSTLPPQPKENGHLSPTDSLKSNSTSPDTNIATSSSSPSCTTIQPTALHQNSGLQVAPKRVSSPSSGSRSTHCSNAQHRFSPPAASRVGVSHSPPNQHVVHVHVNDGETFAVRVGDQIQHIQGPATVRMVSNNGPPLPMPMQVPPGHMVQQIVDEHGILTHVILSPQPTGMPGNPMSVGYHGGPNNAAQYYSYGPHYAAPHPQYPPHHHAHHGAAPHIHPGVPPHHIHGTPPPHTHTCNNHAPAVHATGPSPPLNSVDDRTIRQRARIKAKYIRRLEDGYYNRTLPPRRSKNNKNTNNAVNGDVLHQNSSSSSTITTTMSTSSENGAELEERKILQQQLSTMPEPKVSNMEARSALVELAPPEYDQNEFEIDMSEFRFELLLSDRGREGKYKPVYSGDATEITLKDLKPATEYYLRACTVLEDLKGNLTEPVSFKTVACEPDAPHPPKCFGKSKTTLSLKWNTACENGSKISTYTLECDQGICDGSFMEVYNGLQKQCRISRLQASTKYSFRLAAINSIGKGWFSDLVTYCTSGTVPSQPDPPMFSNSLTNSITISWIKRPNDDEFQLQMDDETTGHGFIPIFNGSNLSYSVRNLQRNSEYKFRLCAKNEEGCSKWSDVVSCRTMSAPPGPPSKPQIKGKIHAHYFRITWDPPKDDGGSEITKYYVELDDGKGFETVYEGKEREHLSEDLIPGHTYKVRVACFSPGGRGEFSEWCAATTQAVTPGQCLPPKLQGKPKATSLHLRWSAPEIDGGAAVTEYAVQMVSPDNSSREVYRGRDMDCIVAGLSPGKVYLFQTRAMNRAGAGPWSELLEVVSGPGVPDCPKVPLLTTKSPHCILICWEKPVNNGAPITDFKLEWQQRADADFAQLYGGPLKKFEARGLTPATSYSFRVLAINAAGSGPFSPIVTCITPPSSPSAVVNCGASSTATEIKLEWEEPSNNGSEIIAYNVEIGETVIPINRVTEYVIDNLLPDTTYRIRIQAVNPIGSGVFSSLVKISTKSLPPEPPTLECVTAAPNNLKIRWGDGRNYEMINYTLEMEKDNGGFQPVYTGPAHMHKVNKLSELTSYDFRIYAINEAGSGRVSDTYTFSTLKTPPPPLKAPRVSGVSINSCTVEWQGCKPMGSDTVQYMLQLLCVSRGEHEFRSVYRGEETLHVLQNLQPKFDYQLRVGAVRQCEDGVGDVPGAFSPGIPFTTLSPEPVKSVDSKLPEARLPKSKPLTDHQLSILILLGFGVLAIFLATLAHQVLKYTSKRPDDHLS